jgi:hypothetical protein
MLVSTEQKTLSAYAATTEQGQKPLHVLSKIAVFQVNGAPTTQSDVLRKLLLGMQSVMGDLFQPHALSAEPKLKPTIRTTADHLMWFGFAHRTTSRLTPCSLA